MTKQMHINYEKLIEKSLLNVVSQSLKIAEENGCCPGEHHFYITFKTSYPGVIIPKFLKEQYPDEITIVLQHQFFDLKVGTGCFSVNLSFQGYLETLLVPLDAIVSFTDPYAKFALAFNVENTNNTDERSCLTENKSTTASAPAEVVSIDAFRKK